MKNLTFYNYDEIIYYSPKPVIIYFKTSLVDTHYRYFVYPTISKIAEKFQNEIIFSLLDLDQTGSDFIIKTLNSEDQILGENFIQTFYNGLKIDEFIFGMEDGQYLDEPYPQMENKINTILKT
ncbi:MAG: hypothetical protein ACXAC7_16975, partial [Candidatus Hodarchaeales archaeon]